MNTLVGGDLTIFKNMSSSMGRIDYPFILWKMANDWNHQPVIINQWLLTIIKHD